MARSGKSSNIAFRIALVSVGFIAGLAAVAVAYRDGAGKVADAFADARAAAALQRPAGDIGAAAIALRGDAVALRSNRASDGLKAFADTAKDLSAKLDALAAAPHGDALAKPIGDLKTQVAAIGKAFDAVQQAQQTAGESATIGPVGKSHTDAKTLLDDTNAAYKDGATLEGEQMRRAAAAMQLAQLQYEATFDDQLKSDFNAAAADYNAAFNASNLADDVKATLNLDVNNYVDAFKEASAAELAYSQATDALVKAFDPLAAAIKDLGDAVAAASDADGGLAAAQADTRDHDRPRRRDCDRHRPDFDHPRLPQPRQADPQARRGDDPPRRRRPHGRAAGARPPRRLCVDRATRSNGSSRRWSRTTSRRAQRRRGAKSARRTRPSAAKAKPNAPPPRASRSEPSPRWRKPASACPKAT